MKVYLLENRIMLVGKAWEIRNKLMEYSEYSKHYTTVSEWLQEMKK